MNDSDTEIMINDSESVYTIPAKAQVAVHLNPTNVECITMKVTGSEYWSAPFDIKNAGKVYVREEHANQLFRISRTIHSPNFFISFSSTDSWPFVIRNLTTMSFKISQKVFYKDMHGRTTIIIFRMSINIMNASQSLI